jgi:SSS family solute:Na+ symporter
MLVDTPATLSKSFHHTEGFFFWIVKNINLQHFSILITIVSAIVMVGVSYMTSEPDYGRIEGLTFSTATAEGRAQTRASWSWREVAASIVVMLLIIGAYVYFTG